MNRVNHFRKLSGLSQAALAKKAGLAQPTIWGYEQGGTAGIEQARAIVTALNEAGVACTLDDVFPPSASSAA